MVAVAGSLLYFFYDPAVSNLFPKCIFHSLTHLDCPGCGSQRAIHSILNGDVIAAADYNLLIVLFLPILCYSIVVEFANGFFNQVWEVRILHSALFVKIVLILVIGFWIARNLPYSALSWLSSDR